MKISISTINTEDQRHYQKNWLKQKDGDKVLTWGTSQHIVIMTQLLWNNRTVENTYSSSFLVCPFLVIVCFNTICGCIEKLSNNNEWEITEEITNEVGNCHCMSKLLFNKCLINNWPPQPTILFETGLKKKFRKSSFRWWGQNERKTTWGQPASFRAHLQITAGVTGPHSLNVDEVVAALVALHSQLTGPPLLHLRAGRSLSVDRVHLTHNGLDTRATWHNTCKEQRVHSMTLVSCQSAFCLSFLQFQEVLSQVWRIKYIFL